MIRKGTIDCILRVLRIKNDLRSVEFVSTLKSILARNCQARVRKAFERFEDIDLFESGSGYMTYLMSAGLSVDLIDGLIQQELRNQRSRHGCNV